MSIFDFFDQDVTVQRATESTTGWGGTKTWIDNATIKAAVTKTHGFERFSADKKTVFADYKLYMASTEDITEKDVLLWNGVYMNPVYIQDTLQRGHHLKILAKIDYNKAAT